MIELRDVTCRFGPVTAVQTLSLSIGAGEFAVLLGGSGSGKSTTLRLINRLCEADSGTVWFHGADVRTFRPEHLRRRMGYAIQSVGLFPHRTIAQNIGTVPALLRWPAARIRDRTDALLHLLGLPPDRFAHRYPHQLSGGEQQRAGVARALAAEPEVLLMDEPFGALDPLTRADLQQEMRRLHRAAGTTVVFVTHDVDEALRLGTRLVLMHQGRIVQQGRPSELLSAPATPFVADFLGGPERPLKRLALLTAGAHVRPGEVAHGEPLDAQTTLRDALCACLDRGTDRVPVAAGSDTPAGVVHLADLLRSPS